MKLLFENWRSHLEEGISDIVYHGTSLGRLSDIAKGNRLMTSGVFGADEETVIGQGKFYFLSTARSPSAFRSGYPLVKDGKTRITLDGKKIGQKYSGAPVDYWRDRTSGGKSEMEDRIITDDAWIENAADYITEIVVYLPILKGKATDSDSILGSIASDKPTKYEYIPNRDIGFADIKALKEVSDFAQSHGIPLKIIPTEEKESEFYMNNQPSAVSYDEFDKMRKELDIDPEERTHRGKERDAFHVRLRNATSYSLLPPLMELTKMLTAGNFNSSSSERWFPTREDMLEVKTDLYEWSKKPNFEEYPLPEYDEPEKQELRRKFLEGQVIVTKEDIDDVEERLTRFKNEAASVFTTDFLGARTDPRRRPFIQFFTKYMRSKKLENVRELVKHLEQELKKTV